MYGAPLRLFGAHFYITTIKRHVDSKFLGKWRGGIVVHLKCNNPTQLRGAMQRRIRTVKMHFDFFQKYVTPTQLHIFSPVGTGGMDQLKTYPCAH